MEMREMVMEEGETERERERVRGREGGENESIVYNKIFTLYHNTIPQFFRCKDTRHHHFNTA